MTVVERLADGEPGEWVLLGGSLTLAVGASDRATLDIDLGRADAPVWFSPAGLMGIAESLGIPIEAINQASNYFLHKQPFKDLLIPFVTGKASTVYRPHFDLFLRLKLERLSHTDAGDIIAYGALYRDEVNRESLSTKWLELESKHAAKSGWPRLSRWREAGFADH